MGADYSGQFGLPIDPVVASGLSIGEINLISQQVAGASAAADAAAAAQLLADQQAAMVASEEARLAALLSNQEQAQWAEEQIAAQDQGFWGDLAQEYVDFFEGDSETAALLTDPVDVILGGTADIVTDVLGTDVITGSITAAGGAAATVLDPITDPIGQSAGKLLVPAAILGGAYLLLK